MNKYEEKIFKNKSFDEEKLIDFGFLKEKDLYFYETKIFNDQFLLKISISKQNINSTITEIETNEPYTLFLAENAYGNFVGNVRESYLSILNKICQKCFYKEVFLSHQAKEILSFVQKNYQDSLEFLWEDSPKTAILRRKDTKKWYAVFVHISKEKLGLKSTESCDMIDLRINSEVIENVVDNKKYFKGYHMNKKYWITIVFDGSVETDQIIERLKDSYNLAKK